MRAVAPALAAVAVALAAGGCGALSATPTPTPVPEIIGGQVGPFSFSYPSAWSFEIAGAPQHYRTVFGFVVAPPATARETCGPDAASAGCDEQVTVPSGSVAITMAAWAQPDCVQTAQEIVAADVAQGWMSVTVGGRPAAYDQAAADPAGFTRTWEIAGPAKGDCSVYELKAQFGASAAGLAPKVDALVASINIRIPGP
jgi:hypothetical protein